MCIQYIVSWFFINFIAISYMESWIWKILLYPPRLTEWKKWRIRWTRFFEIIRRYVSVLFQCVSTLEISNNRIIHALRVLRFEQYNSTSHKRERKCIVRPNVANNTRVNFTFTFNRLIIFVNKRSGSNHSIVYPNLETYLRILDCRESLAAGQSCPGPPTPPKDTDVCKCTVAQSGPSTRAPSSSPTLFQRCPRTWTPGSVVVFCPTWWTYRYDRLPRYNGPRSASDPA